MNRLEQILYETKDDQSIFGDHWCGPEIYTPQEQNLAAEYYPLDGSDGQSARVYCTPMPARFYTVKIDGYELDTGSNQAKLAADIAAAIANGMLGVEIVEAS